MSNAECGKITGLYGSTESRALRLLIPRSWTPEAELKAALIEATGQSPIAIGRRLGALERNCYVERSRCGQLRRAY